MAIDRAPWTALVDDDGSNLVGTVWNKDKIKTVILDPTDAAILANPVASTGTGTLHNVACGPASLVTVLRCSNASDATITGVSFTTPPRTGDLLAISAAWTGAVYLPHNHAGSTVKFYNHATSAPLPLAPLTGRAIYVFDGVAWILHQHEQGAWITVPYSAAHFVAGWTVEAGDIQTLCYRLTAKTLAVSFAMSTTSVASATPALQILAPAFGGFTPARPMTVGHCYLNDLTANYAVGFLQVGSLLGHANIVLYRAALSNWAAGANQTTVGGYIAFEVT